MTLRPQTFLTGLLALLAATLLALVLAGAKPTSGGNEFFEPAASEHQHAIRLASLGNSYYRARIASECCNAPNKGVWTVDPSFRSVDEAAGVLVNGSYIKNPTARNLSESITASGKVRVDGQLANGQYMYVVDTSGNTVIGTRGGQRMPHPTLVGGSNLQVQAAGIVDIRGGKIYSVDDASGHFKPGSGSLQSAESAFGNLPSNSFHTDFQGYVPFDD